MKIEEIAKVCHEANRAYCEWHGLRQDQVIGMALNDLLDPERMAAVGPLLPLVAAGQAQRYTVSAVDRDGRTVHRQIDLIREIAWAVAEGGRR